MLVVLLIKTIQYHCGKTILLLHSSVIAITILTITIAITMTTSKEQSNNFDNKHFDNKLTLHIGQSSSDGWCDIWSRGLCLGDEPLIDCSLLRSTSLQHSTTSSVQYIAISCTVLFSLPDTLKKFFLLGIRYLLTHGKLFSKLTTLDYHSFGLEY
jgi:hypothetical protein